MLNFRTNAGGWSGARQAAARALLAGVFAFSCASSPAAAPASIEVEAGQPGIAVPSTLHGLFFEDINYAADGGLYAELIQNRSFEHREPLYGWSQSARGAAHGRLTIENEAPLNARNLNFLRIHVTDAGRDGFGVMNSGFGGIPLRAGERYIFSVYARRRAGDAATLRVALEAPGVENGSLSTNLGGLTEAWTKLEAVISSTVTTTNARLSVLATAPGVVDVDMVSLFPGKTFRGRPNGLRADLARALAELKPGFLRFPGGCVVEGRDKANAYRWKETIGDVAERKQNWNLWQDRQSPQYSQTYGLGFFEYSILRGHRVRAGAGD